MHRCNGLGRFSLPLALLLGACAMTPLSAAPWPADMPKPMVKAIQADAARRAAGLLNTASNAASNAASNDSRSAPRVSLHRAEAVTWPDGALGCPKPGQMVTQALVPGWRLEIRAGAQQWVYHTSRQGAWLMCPSQRAQPPVRGGRDVI